MNFDDKSMFKRVMDSPELDPKNRKKTKPTADEEQVVFCSSSIVEPVSSSDDTLAPTQDKNANKKSIQKESTYGDFKIDIHAYYVYLHFTKNIISIIICYQQEPSEEENAARAKQMREIEESGGFDESDSDDYPPPPGYTPSQSDGNTNDTIPTLIDENEDTFSAYEESQAQHGIEDLL
jgi:hypothetical protein